MTYYWAVVQVGQSWENHLKEGFQFQKLSQSRKVKAQTLHVDYPSLVGEFFFSILVHFLENKALEVIMNEFAFDLLFVVNQRIFQKHSYVRLKEIKNLVFLKLQTYLPQIEQECRFHLCHAV